MWIPIVLFAIYGAADLMCRLICRLFFSAQWHNGYFVVPLRADDTALEYAVRHGRWLRCILPYGRVRIVVVDYTDAANDTVLQLCERLQADYVTAEEWKKMQENALQDEKNGV